jgi:hypothetical protein
MSYQLVFWKQPPGEPADPQAVCEQPMDGELAAGLDEVPGDDFLTRITERFAAGFERLDGCNWERADGSFQVAFGPRHFLVISYSLPDEVLDEFVDIAAEFGCRLYDS